jgi:hypothetical protein
MKSRPHGNESGKINVRQDDMHAWTRVHTYKPDVVPDDLGLYLLHA